MNFFGPFCFGLVVGWMTCRVFHEVKATDVTWLTAVIGVIGGGAVAALFQQRPDLFNAYSVGLGLGFLIRPTAKFFEPYWIDRLRRRFKDTILYKNGAQAEAANMQAQFDSLKSELQGEKERSAQTTTTLIRQELSAVETRIAETQGALSEAKDQFKHEQERNRDLFGRVVSEAAKAKAELAQMQAQERDHLRQKLSAAETRIAETQGALSEVKDQFKHEQERNRELSGRVVSEAAKAKDLSARLEEVEKMSSPSAQG
jgi:hypothetical protein